MEKRGVLGNDTDSAAQALLRHRVPSGELAHVLDHALDALLVTLAREKFGATTRPRTGRSRSAVSDPRHVPSQVKRAVHARDGEQCAFVSEAGERCLERGFLELDHRTPVARGGQATVENMRLLCKAHNEYEAERIFGTAFMQSRRTRAKKAQPCTAPAGGLAAPAPAPAVTASVAAETVTVPAPAPDMIASVGAVTAPAPAPAMTASVAAVTAPDIESDALLGLRSLGFTAAEARTALARTAHLLATTLEQRLRMALAELHRADLPESRTARSLPLDSGTLKNLWVQ